MAESFFDKLKKTVIEGAATAASKAESATRLGKLHLDKMSEERKLQEKEATLGRFVYELAGENQLDSIQENADFLAKVGEIRLGHEAIASIQAEIDSEGAKAKADSTASAQAKEAEPASQEVPDAEVVSKDKSDVSEAPKS